MLDITIGLNELNYVKDIHIVGVNNEVKELLWCLEQGYTNDTTIKTINIKNNTAEVFNYKLSEETLAQANYSPPMSYLYEPNTSILKSGAFHTISNALNINKLHKHSHLYTSDRLITFPGRRFKIERSLPYSKKFLKKEAFSKANITTRNFPESVEQIRKRYRIKEGGSMYLFFTTTNTNSKVVLVCSKVV